MGLIERMKNPLSDIDNTQIEQVNLWFKDIAKELFSQYCILCAGKEYYFAEVEFYYFDKDIWNAPWNKVTYARDGYNAGDLFFHFSGIDICFDSHYSDNRFGGILIRSLKNEEGILFTGPLSCKDELLNVCKGKGMPMLDRRKKPVEMEPQPTKRLLGKADMENGIDGVLNLCYYDNTITDWDTKRERYDKNGGGTKTYTKKYTIKRN